MAAFFVVLFFFWLIAGGLQARGHGRCDRHRW